ncbi:ABC transporter ATP-binding protein [Acidisphaera sp. S103]|uniref:ABC transporter ATP-binding protein n=1 Tax=Acidisphaera sp. S103 TaxID=1747223 RepID=UPI001C20C17D|nr:ABC transporter ATP-binding protein [Acidisphaera sp. S103]
MTDDALIEYRNVARRFHSRSGTVVACEDVNLSVRRGEFMAVVGPSGCGKSTLLNMAAGLMAPSAGQVFYGGRQVPAPNTDVGYLTQRDTLLPWRTVEDNVAIALELRGQSRADRLRVAHEWLDRMGLIGFEKSYPAQLSGGMRRRVALARTLAYEPETILMDEPFGALDAQLRMVMHEELLKLWTGMQKTVIFVTHDLAEALTLADRIAVFSARPGRIRSVETVDLPRPRDVFRIRFDPHFGKLHDRLWSYLEASVRSDVMVN